MGLNGVLRARGRVGWDGMGRSEAGRGGIRWGGVGRPGVGQGRDIWQRELGSELGSAVLGDGFGATEQQHSSYSASDSDEGTDDQTDEQAYLDRLSDLDFSNRVAAAREQASSMAQAYAVLEGKMP